MRDLDAVIDPHRLLYVAGANRETPVGIRIESDGKFSYRKSLDGDGRVPHELGLLEGVTTYWVDETHGDLAKNGHVLDAITELLQTGKTTVLATTKPAKPTRAAPSRDWEPAEAVAPLPVEARAIAEKAKVQRRSTGEPHLTPEEEQRLRNLTLAEYLGSGQAPGPDVRGGRVDEEAFTVEDAGEGEDAGEDDGAEPRAEAPSLQMEIEVVWGDVTKVDADVYAVGHYEGVTPQYAELALDEAVSGVRGTEGLRVAEARHHAARRPREPARRPRRRVVLPLGRRAERQPCRRRRRHGPPGDVRRDRTAPARGRARRRGHRAAARDPACAPSSSARARERCRSAGGARLAGRDRRRRGGDRHGGRLRRAGAKRIVFAELDRGRAEEHPRRARGRARATRGRATDPAR